MKILGDLMVGAHHRDRLGRLQAHVGEQAAKVFREVVLRVVGVAELVVAQLELHRAPGPAFVGEPHVERLHDVRRRHRGRPRCSPLDQPAGEPCPAGHQGLLEVRTKPSQRLNPSRVEILGEPGPSPIAQSHGTATLDGSLGQHLSDHDQRHPDAPTQSQVLVSFDVANALVQRSNAPRGIEVSHDRNAFLSLCHSPVVNRPSFRACFAASISRSVSMRPRHSRSASATACDSRPS